MREKKKGKDRQNAGKTPSGDGGRKKSRAIGADKEEEAAAFLAERGYCILERNFVCQSGEIDLIAKEGGYLVFIEVKYRATDEYGLPQEAVGSGKIRRIVRTARYYMMKKGIPEDMPCRFDVVAAFRDCMEVIENAFDASV